MGTFTGDLGYSAKTFKITIITKITRPTKLVRFADVKSIPAKACTMVES